MGKNYGGRKTCRLFVATAGAVWGGSMSQRNLCVRTKGGVGGFWGFCVGGGGGGGGGGGVWGGGGPFGVYLSGGGCGLFGWGGRWGGLSPLLSVPLVHYPSFHIYVGVFLRVSFFMPRFRFSVLALYFCELPRVILRAGNEFECKYG